MEKDPKVSIIIPVYNGSNYLKKAIDCAIAQTYKNTEILVINDGSTDETEQIALSYGDKIKYIKKGNGGVSSALNLGIKEMTGEFFSWLSHDDEYAKTKVEEQINLLQKFNDEKMICLCDYLAIDKESKFLKKSCNKHKFKNEQIISSNELLKQMLKKGTYDFCAFLIPKKVFDECGSFDESLRFVQDFLMCCKMFFAEYNVIYLKSPLVFNRIHANQVTQTRKDLFYKESEMTSKYLIPEFLKVSTRKENILYEYAIYSAKNNGDSIASNCIKVGKENRLFSKRKILNIKIVKLYGKIRPLIRKIYYKVFLRVKTK